MLHAGILLLLLATVGRTQESRIEQLRWLAGCWERSRGSMVVEEQWMAPRGGIMLGMSRTVRAGRAVAWESLRIYEWDAALVYAAHPSGQQPAEFRSTSAGADSVVFENRAHDFPQRIAYRAAGDSLFARIEGPAEGGTRGIDFRFARTRCAESGDGG